MKKPSNFLSGLIGDNLQDHQQILDQDTVTSHVVEDINRKKEEEQTAKLANKFQIPYMNLAHYQPDPTAVGMISKDLAKTGNVFVFKKENNTLYIAISNMDHPQTGKALETIQQQFTDTYKLIPVLVSQSNMDYLLSIYDTFAPTVKTGGDIQISKEQQQTAMATLQNWTTSAKLPTNVSITSMFDVMLAAATFANASDIHIEPAEKDLHIRFRIDGVLQDAVVLPSTALNPFVSRIKLLSQLKLNITESAQDGRFSFKVANSHYDVRVSLLPTSYGESAVLRLLPQEGNFITLEELGLSGYYMPILEKAIKEPNGLILNTGPTGSGKTTTLYAILNKVNQPGTKIITIEDPIEYKLKGITQSQVNPEEKYTFATGLKSILRQDPDVVLVGEIRDKETADIAINASLTGHLVLSTLHTNDAAGAIPRLADLGLKPEYFIESIVIIMAQRLVRQLCPKCSESYTPSAEEITTIKNELATLPKELAAPVIPAQLKRANPNKSCTNCNGTGYKGRLAIFEILQRHDDITKAVLTGSFTVGQIKELAMQHGMVTLKQDGLLKVLAGTTSLDELNRVVSAEES